MYSEKSAVSFPAPSGANVNMLPILAGVADSVPEDLRGYQPMIDACGFERGDVVYLTVTESRVESGTQRRGGVHVEAPVGSHWGGGWGGTRGGLYMASSDGACRLWDTLAWGDSHGAVDRPDVAGERCKPDTLYWLTDQTPHEALESRGLRQFFRLVSREIGVWWERHNTPSPYGIRPQAPVVRGSKFG